MCIYFFYPKKKYRKLCSSSLVNQQSFSLQYSSWGFFKDFQLFSFRRIYKHTHTHTYILFPGIISALARARSYTQRQNWIGAEIARQLFFSTIHSLKSFRRYTVSRTNALKNLSCSFFVTVFFFFFFYSILYFLPVCISENYARERKLLRNSQETAASRVLKCIRTRILA